MSHAPTLAGRVAVITGASSGIGEATALHLSAAGATVALVGRRAERLSAVAQAITERGGQAIVCAGDLTEEAAVTNMVEQVIASCGTIDLLVNNAGETVVGNVEGFSTADWDRVFAINTRAVFLACRAVLPSMRANGGGHIIQITSVAARTGFPGWAAYCASKAAVVGFSRALLEEVRSAGIRVSVLYPGAVDSPLWESFPNDFKRDRMLRVEEVAEAVLWTASQPAHLLVEDLSMTYLAGTQ